MGDANFGEEPGGTKEPEDVMDSISKSNVEFMAPPPVEGVGGGGTGYGWNDGSGSTATILTSDADISRIPTSDLVHMCGVCRARPSSAIKNLHGR